MLKSSITVVVADLESPRIAAFTAAIDGKPVAVVNALAREDPDVREEAERVLADIGVDAHTIREVLDGIRR